MRKGSSFRAPVVVLFLLLLTPCRTPAQEGYTVMQTIFLPPRFYVGDRVELRIRIRTGPGLSVTAPEVLPETSWVIFHDVSVISREAEKDVRIVFSPFYPGTQTLPSLRLGDITLRDVKVHTDTLLTGNREDLRPPRGQVLLPGTRLYFTVAVFIFIVSGLILVGLLVLGRNRVRQLTVRYRERRPYRRLRKAMKKLRSQVESMDARTFYIFLLDELRTYLSGRLGRDCRSATTREMARHLENYLENNLLDPNAEEQGSVRGTFLSLFRQGDLVKFGHAPSVPAERLASLDSLSEVLRLLEHTRSAGARAARKRRKEKRTGRRTKIGAEKEAVDVDV